MNRALHKVIEQVWQTGKWPADWTQSTFVPIYKKGDPTVCANYRTISLISHASKVLLKIIQDRMREKMEFEVAEEQSGFRQGRGTQNYLFNLRILTERARTHKQPLFLCFIDFEKAFDTVSHKKLWKAMLDMGFAPHLVTLIKSLYTAQRSNARTNERLLHCFKRSQTRLFTLSISLQHTCGVVDACGTGRLLWRISYRWAAHKQSETCR